MKLTRSLPMRFTTYFQQDQHQPNRANTLSAVSRVRVRIAAGIFLAAALCLLAPTVAVASTATSTMAVSATVVSSCTISTTSMAFGTYNSAVLNGTATVSATCSNTTPYNVGLNAGTANGATVTTRAMFVSGTPAVVLNYGLYSNSSRTTNWGMTVNTDTVAGTGNGSAQSITIYGQIPAGQLVAPGTYTDTITATITY